MKKRKTKLINPRLQSRYLLLLLLCAGATVLTHTALLSFAMTGVASTLPSDGQVLVDALPQLLTTQALIALALLVPGFLILGVASSLRVFGPLYRFRAFLEAVVAGNHPEPCRLRENDELQDICDLLNEATAATRATQSEAASAEGQGVREAA